jgi:anti-anti-sigma regulatory factor
MQWELETVDGVGVLHLTGFLGERSTHRFRGALDWVAARCPGAIVIDLTALKGWSTEGEGAIVDAAGRLADRGPLAVCGLRERPGDLLRTSSALHALQLYPDLDTALAALGAH